MHLLNVQPGAIDDGAAAVDLDQSPAEVVVLSAADTELATLAAAHARLGTDAPSLRLANLLHLKHPMSVDLYVERVVGRARLVILRLLGGASYWPYGTEEVARVARETGIAFAALPGDQRPDEALERVSTLKDAPRRRLWGYLGEGGLDNAENLLRYAGHLLGRGPEPPGPRPLPTAGLYWPGLDRPSLADLRAHWRAGAPVAAVTFYRALAQSGQTETIDALVAALTEAGLNALPIFAASFKEEAARQTAERLLAEAETAIVVNCTGFALSAPGASSQPSSSVGQRPSPLTLSLSPQGRGDDNRAAQEKPHLSPVGRGRPAGPGEGEHTGNAQTVLDGGTRPVLQAIMAGASEEAWAASARGLGPRDIAMNVALPEIDGRIVTRAIAFKAEARFDAATEAPIVVHRPEASRVRFVAELAARWAALATAADADKRIGLILANYPNRDGRIGNGVGLDTPASAAALIGSLAEAGYEVGTAPRDGAALMDLLLAGPTNAPKELAIASGERLPLSDYGRFFAGLPETVQEAVTARWGAPEADPFVRDGAFALAVHRFGNLAVGIQPARGYNLDPKATYHDPDLVPPHAYLAFHAWLRTAFSAHALVQIGKHGNLEWLPGKALGLSEECFPEAALGPTPLIYPFIVNDPGEGAQAKRRAAAVVVDHLTPPLARAETYGPLRELEALVDEYFEAAQVDPPRADRLRGEILDHARATGLDADCGIAAGMPDQAALQALDAHLCDLKELQIRDGLHVFGQSPDGPRLDRLLVALARVPRSGGNGGDASLLRALAADLGLTCGSPSLSPTPLDPHPSSPFQGEGEIGAPPGPPHPSDVASPSPWKGEGRGGGPSAGAVSSTRCFDPLVCDMAAPWCGQRADALAGLTDDPWRTNGDTVERLELLAEALVAGGARPEPGWTATGAVLGEIETRFRPAIAASGPAETAATLAALSGRFVAPGPAGAPSRGRPEVLPTGRNFYSLDSRAVPTEAAWALGRKSAELLITEHRQREGEWLAHVALSAWGTANMRTGGDDIAQGLALIGVKPTWERASGRVTGFEVLPLAELGRPRVDVTLRASGFFRDAFPTQIDLFDSAVRAVAALDEDEADNPLAARVAADRAALLAEGLSAEEAERRAGYRVFSSMPGAYGAGLQALIDEGVWESRADFAEAYTAWSAFAYGQGAEGERLPELFTQRLGHVQAVVHNQDNREHDLLDSDDYYQFEGGLSAAVERARGARPAIYHNDHSRPETPKVRSLEEEIARVVRGRAANPKWIAGVMRHGYKGAFEIAATVDYLFAFQATTGAVKDHHFDLLFDAYLGDEAVRGFLAEANAPALAEIAARFREALERRLWRPRLNRVYDLLERIEGGT